MNTLILLLEQGSSWSPESWMLSEGARRGASDELVLEQGSCSLTVVRDDRVLADFDEQERAELAQLLSDPVPFVIEWRGSDLLNALLRAVSVGTRAVVDNDHGLLVPIERIRDLPLERWVSARELI